MLCFFFFFMICVFYRVFLRTEIGTPTCILPFIRNCTWVQNLKVRKLLSAGIPNKPFEILYCLCSLPWQPLPITGSGRGNSTMIYRILQTIGETLVQATGCFLLGITPAILPLARPSAGGLSPRVAAPCETQPCLEKRERRGLPLSFHRQGQSYLNSLLH